MKLTEDDIVEWWLFKYHGIHLKDAYEPKWGNDPKPFYDKYPVTREQYDEWYAWLVKSLMKESGTGKKRTEGGLWPILLTLAPIIK